ncbi:MAG TPA: glycosyltransferase [Marinilabiliales bacterium]|nr:glycosyltransferase [Marinilabiliales bacterium]HAZ00761.1 glycosyltransferase [Marinilabiliales bacterium]HBO75766.1 glycosyltransferase [Marinilabiliales bacterium]HBY54634.1 glycosyltransferase [Marinilabiliales bacterium]
MKKTNPMEALYVSYDGMTDPLGQSQVIPYLAGLAAKGFSISLISCEKSIPYKKEASNIKQLLKANHINWYPVFYTKKPPILSTVFDIWKMKQKAHSLHRTKNFDIVHCRSYIAAFVGLSLQKKGCRWIFDMRGFWADERVDGHIWNLKNPIFKQIYGFFKSKEREFLKSADHIVSLTQAGKLEMLTWNIPELTPDKISVIPCCADLNHFNNANITAEAQTRWREKLSIDPNAYVLSYLGSVGTWYLPDEMLDFFKILKQKEPSALFLFITKDDPQRLKELALSKNISVDDIRIQPATRNQVPGLLSISQASLFFIKPVWSKKASSPTKLAEIMGLGIPVVTNSGVGDVDWVMHKNPNGVLVESFTEQSYVIAVSQLLSFPQTKPKEIRQLACDYFSLEHGISIFESVYHSSL